MSVTSNIDTDVETLGDLDDYSDFVVQNVAFTFDFDEANQLAQGQATPSTSIAPGGGVDRDEAWELVALVPQHETLMPVDQAGRGTTPGSVLADWQYYRYPTDWTTTNQEVSGDDAFTFTNVETIPDNPDLLYQTRVSMTAAFNDTVNGTGGGGSMSGSIGTPRYFRNLSGGNHGPIFEDENTFNTGINVQWWDMQDQRFRVSGAVKLYWDRWELESRRVRDVKG